MGLPEKVETNAPFIVDWTEVIYEVIRKYSEVIFRLKVLLYPPLSKSFLLMFNIK